MERQGSILVVDDDLLNRTLLSIQIEEQGYQVEALEDGEQALRALTVRPFDLVLLDIMMPHLDGYGVLARLQADHRLRNIPVIVTTAVDELDSTVKCIEMGAEDYLLKPVNPVLLRARIGASLEKKRLRDQLRGLIGKFATEDVADDLLQHGFSLGGKLLNATVMFCDIRSFTTITESNPPADVIRLLNEYYSLAMEAIGAEGGIINQMIGDGLMSVFGAPIPRANPRESAVRAALRLQANVDVYNRGAPLPISVGVGIASGEVIAGYTGTQQRATYTCVGDTVNIAARLEGATKTLRRAVLVDAHTRLGLGDHIQAEDHGTVEVKGKSAPVRVFSVHHAPARSTA